MFEHSKAYTSPTKSVQQRTILNLLRFFYATPKELKKPLNHIFSKKSLMLKLFFIGFGHLSPGTDLGKGICIIYSLLGVPINGILIGSLGAYFGNKVSYFSKKPLILGTNRANPRSVTKGAPDFFYSQQVRP